MFSCDGEIRFSSFPNYRPVFVIAKSAAAAAAKSVTSIDWVVIFDILFYLKFNK